MRWSLIFPAVLAAAFFAPAACGEDGEYDDPVALVDKIVESNQAIIERVERGSGKAVVTETAKGRRYENRNPATIGPGGVVQRHGEPDWVLRDVDEESRRAVDFSFLGNLERVTFYSADAAGGGAETEKTIIKGGEAELHYYPARSELFIDKRTQDRLPSLGEEFRPQVIFTQSQMRPLRALKYGVRVEERYEQSQKYGWDLGMGRVNVEETGDGLLRVTITWDEKDGWERFITATVDPERDYALLSYEHSGVATSRGRNIFNREKYEIEWAEHDGLLFPAQLKRTQRERSRHPDVEQGRMQDTTYTTEITFSQFDADPALADEEFTREGLDVPAGTEVIDRISGETYVAGARGEEMVEGLEADAEMAPEPSEEPEKTAAAEDPEAAPPAGETAPQGPPAEAPSGGGAGVWLLLAGVVVVAVGLGLWWKSRGRR